MNPAVMASFAHRVALCAHCQVALSLLNLKPGNDSREEKCEACLVEDFFEGGIGRVAVGLDVQLLVELI